MPFSIKADEYRFGELEEIKSIIAKEAEAFINGFMKETWDNSFSVIPFMKDSGEWGITALLGDFEEYEKVWTLEELFASQLEPYNYEKDDTDRLAKQLEDIASRLRAKDG